MKLNSIPTLFKRKKCARSKKNLVWRKVKKVDYKQHVYVLDLIKLKLYKSHEVHADTCIETA